MRNCVECKEHRFKDGTVDRWDHEQDMARLERVNHQSQIAWLIIALTLLVLFVGTNIYWINVSKQYEQVRIEQDSTEGGYNNFIGNDGDIYNGEADDNLLP